MTVAEILVFIPRIGFRCVICSKFSDRSGLDYGTLFETDEDIARYSVLRGNEQLFASKYKLYLPNEELLRAEIESQKAIFQIQNGGF